MIGVDMSRDAIAERYARIARLTYRGLSRQQIADRLRVTTRTVDRARRAYGCSTPKPPPLSDAEKRTAQALLDDGASCTEVAKTLGRNNKTIIAHFPDYKFDKYRAAAAASLGRAMARLERKKHIQRRDTAAA